ncbi:MAG: hypothetical protein CBD27_09170 [Rhodospirillaceae bacterium TMED167]|nr:hypothetical protein [Rhodospirillaceae bacterium]OUW25713.1 MAG: hypothetical protein CBD27_09170 [Rhodospirillaceae bacterium TMED167]
MQSPNIHRVSVLSVRYPFGRFIVISENEVPISMLLDRFQFGAFFSRIMVFALVYIRLKQP